MINTILRLFSTLWFYRSLLYGLHGIKEQFETLIFSPVASYIPNSVEWCFPFIISHFFHFWCGFKFLRKCQIYTPPPPSHAATQCQCFLATREIVLVHVSTSINRIADTVIRCYICCLIELWLTTYRLIDNFWTE